MIPAAVPRRGNALTRGLGRALLGLMGWRVEGQAPDAPKVVAVGAPHTSNWDFLVLIGVLFSLGLRVSWIGKHTLFRPPFGMLMRWLGGVAVDRSAAQDVVAQTIARFHREEKLFLCIAPEGTRTKVKQWKTGFYRIAHGAGVPILLCYADYGRKVAGLGPVVIPTEDQEAGIAQIRAFYRAVRGRHPHEDDVGSDEPNPSPD